MPTIITLKIYRHHSPGAKLNDNLGTIARHSLLWILVYIDWVFYHSKFTCNFRSRKS